jgi:hypothetical protein
VGYERTRRIYIYPANRLGITRREKEKRRKKDILYLLLRVSRKEVEKSRVKVQRDKREKRICVLKTEVQESRIEKVRGNRKGYNRVKAQKR